MDASERFNAIVIVLTISIMFALVVFITPLVQEFSGTVKGASLIVTLLASIGTYRSIAGVLSLVINRWRWLRAQLLGCAYLEGTWVGYFKEPSGEVYLFCEQFTQTSKSLTITGISYDFEGKEHSSWTAVSVDYDVLRQKLSYSYTCQHMSEKIEHQGIGEFTMFYPTSSKFASSYTGHSADLTDGTRSPSNARKETARRFDGPRTFEKALAFANSQGVIPVAVTDVKGSRNPRTNGLRAGIPG